MPRLLRRTRQLCYVAATALLASGLALSPAPADAAVQPALSAAEAPDVYRAQILAKQEHHSVEVTGLRTAESKTVVNADGTFTTEVAQSPMNVQQANGTFEPVNTELFTDKDGRVRARQVPYSLSLSGGGSDSLVDVVPASGKRAEWKLPASLPTPVLDGSTARYVNVRPSVDLLASVTGSGFELSYILTARPNGGLSLNFPLQLTGLSLAADLNGDPQLLSAGKALVQGAPAVMWDANTNPASSRPEDRMAVPQSVSGSTITLNPSAAFLQNPATKYPVVVDPFYGLTFHYGTYVYQASATTNYDGSSYYRSGLATTTTTAQRTLLRFQIPASLTGTHITDASLRIFLDTASSCSATTRVRTLNASFTSSTVTWNTQPTYSGPYDVTGFSAGCANNWQTIHMTDVADLWINGALTNNGFMLNGDETDLTSNKVWRSENHTGTAYRPTLSITYNTYPSITAGRYMSPYQIASDGSWWTRVTGPSFRGAALDSDGGQNKLRAQIFTTARTGTPVWDSLLTANNVTPGTTSIATAPVGTLTNGTTYSWRAKQYDGTDYSTAWSSWIDVTVDTTAPATPSVSSSTYTANSWASTQVDAPFTFSSSGHLDVASWDYRFDGGQWQTKTGNVGTTNSATTFTLTEIPSGWNTLHVVATDRAGNRSSEATFSFGSTAGTTSPSDGTSTHQYVTLKAITGPSNPSVRWKYRLKDADGWVDIPVGAGGAVTDTSLNPVSSWPLSTVTGSLSVSSPTLVLDTRKLLTSGGVTSDGTVQVQAWFNNGSIDYATGNQAIVSLDRNGFGSAYATEQVGPGTLSLGSGNFALSSTDVSVTSYGSDLSLSRTFNSNDPAVSGLMGPGWQSTIGVEDAGSAYTTLTDTNGSVTVVDTDGGQLTFANRNGRYVGQGDADSLTLTSSTPTGWLAPDKFTLLDGEGNETVFSVTSTWAQAASLATPHVYQPSSIIQPGSGQTTSYTYATISSKRVPLRLLAPVTPGVTCPSSGGFSGLSRMGCRALDLSYTTVLGHPQISKATEQTTDGAGNSVTVDLGCFTYDGSGRLSQAWDPRINAVSCSSSPAASDLPITYSYDASGRVSSISPPGMKAYVLAYDGTGRFVGDSRTHSAPWGTGTEADTVVYEAPINNDSDAASGLHPDLSASTTATWAQTDIPLTAVAIFGPGDSLPSLPVSAGDDFRDGTVYGLNGATQTVNTAVYSGSNQSGWKVNTSEYDLEGNTIRTLDAANRDRALRRNDAPALTVDLPVDTAAAALMLDVTNLYALNPNDTTAETGTQLDLVDSFGPLHQVVLPDGSLTAARSHTHFNYDTGSELGHPAPSNVSLHLETSEWTEASMQAGVYFLTGSPSAGPDRRTTTKGYQLNSGADVTGWTFRSPLTVTMAPGGTASPITTTTVLDAVSGMVKEARMPSDTGGVGAGTTVSTYYTSGSLNNGNCVNNAWYMQICKTSPKVQPAGTGAGSAGLPTVSTTYDWLLRPQTVLETVTDASNATQTRSTATVFENAGWSPRVLSRSLTSTVPGTGLPTTTVSYDSISGVLTGVSASGSGSPLTLSHDDFGRTVGFTDADGAQTTTTFDSHGRVATSSEVLAGVTLRSTTLGYSSSTDHRDLLTSRLSSGLGGSFVGSYGPSGELISEVYPNGINAVWSTDETGAQSSVTYSKAGSAWFTDAKQSNIFGQVRSHIGLPSSQAYGYDDTGRLTTVQDSYQNLDATAIDCTTRVYAYAGNAGADSNRTSLTTYAPDGSHGCQSTSAVSTVTSTFDAADRLSGTGAATGIVYDALGRITTLPAALTTLTGLGGSSATNNYYVNDMIASQTSNGFTRTWQLDSSLARARTFTDNSSGVLVTKTNHFDGLDGDAPSWVDEGALNSQTQYTTGLDGNLSATNSRDSGTGATSGLVFNLVNLHGDLVTTASPNATLYDGAVSESDEFGNMKVATGNRYGWLGGKQRSNEAFGNLTTMGARLYLPVLGRFLSVDSVLGGNANAYSYPCDPISLVDLDGRKQKSVKQWDWYLNTGTQKVGKLRTIATSWGETILAAAIGACVGGIGGFIVGIVGAQIFAGTPTSGGLKEHIRIRQYHHCKGGHCRDIFVLKFWFDSYSTTCWSAFAYCHTSHLKLIAWGIGSTRRGIIGVPGWAAQPYYDGNFSWN
jgi:RHS repeat-associated protein